KLIQNCGEVPSLRDLFVTAFGMRRQAHASQVGNDDCVIFNEGFRERDPHIASVPEAMEKKDGGPLAADADVLTAASHRHLLCIKRLRPRANSHDDPRARCRRRELPVVLRMIPYVGAGFAGLPSSAILAELDVAFGVRLGQPPWDPMSGFPNCGHAGRIGWAAMCQKRSFDHLVGAAEQCCGNGETKGPGGL